MGEPKLFPRDSRTHLQRKRWRVVAAEPDEVVMTPGELFAREWFRPYGRDEFADVLMEIAHQTEAEPRPASV